MATREKLRYLMWVPIYAVICWAMLGWAAAVIATSVYVMSSFALGARRSRVIAIPALIVGTLLIAVSLGLVR